MNAQKWISTLMCTTALTAVGATVNFANAAACSAPFVVGDVFASARPQSVSVFTPNGTPVCTLDNGLGGLTTGSGFDSAGNFYVTNFNSAVSKFNNSGALVNSAYFSGLTRPESVTIASAGPFAGSSFVSNEGATSISQFNTATGALAHTFNVTGGNGTGGVDWVDFLTPTTVIYDGEGTHILKYDLATQTQLADFSSPATELALNHIFAMRTISQGTFAGSVLVANSGNALMLDANGNIIKTYTLPGNGGGDFSLNLDPNGVDFWTGDFRSGIVWEINIATGAIDNQWNVGGSDLYGLTVFGELTTVAPPPPPPPSPTPEPASLATLGVGLAALGAVRRRRRRS